MMCIKWNSNLLALLLLQLGKAGFVACWDGPTWYMTWISTSKVGGAFQSDGWRRKLDHVLVQVAMDACAGGWSQDGKPFLPQEPSSSWEHFKLVALHALLASLLSPAGVRPPYLPQGLELFRKGKQGTGSKVAEFCAEALMSLEVLVHPRALPLSDMGTHYLQGKPSDADTKLRTGYGHSHDVYGFLNDIYLANGSESEVPAADGHKNGQFDENLEDISMRRNHEEPNIANASSEKMITDEEYEGTSAKHAVQTEVNDDKVMLAMEYQEGRGETSLDPVSHGDVSASGPVSSPLSLQKEKSNFDESGSVNRGALAPSNFVAPGSVNHAASASGELILATKDIESTAEVKSVVSARADDNTLMLSVVEPDNESSNSFPDIVDGDPDTDSD